MTDVQDGGLKNALLGKLYGKVFLREESMKIVVLGSPGVGKTALIIRCLTDQFFNHYVPGKEASYKYCLAVGPKKIKFDILDSKGKNDAIISHSDAVVLVYSVIDKDSFDNTKTLIKRVRDLNLNNVPIVVIANKIDQSKKRQVSKDDRDSLSAQYNVKVFERSAAIPTDNISSVLEEVYRQFHASKKIRRDSDPNLVVDPTRRMTLKSIRRRSTSLDSNEFIKLVL